MPYDPKKAHDYYERTKKLKGRKPSAPQSPVHMQNTRGSRADGSSRINRHTEQKARANDAAASAEVKSAQARVVRLKSAVSKLTTALSAARAALSAKRQTARDTAKKNSDGKSTAEEKQASKKYRDKHKQEIATKRKSTSSSSTPSSSSTSSVSDMSASELEARIIKLSSALADAKRQLSSATQQLGQLAHSAITSEPTFDEHFARFRSAERRPST